MAGPQDCWSDGCTPHPPGCWPPDSVVPTPGTQAANPSICQAQRLRPRVSSCQHPSDQGRLPAWPLRNYTDLSLSPLPALQGLSLDSSVWFSHAPLVTPSAPQQRKVTSRPDAELEEWPNRCSGCLAYTESGISFPISPKNRYDGPCLQSQHCVRRRQEEPKFKIILSHMSGSELA